MQFPGLSDKRSDTAQKRNSSEASLDDSSLQKKAKWSERQKEESAEGGNELEGGRSGAPANAVNDDINDEDENNEVMKETKQAKKGKKRGKLHLSTSRNLLGFYFPRSAYR